jgi:hypothetical protein
MAQLASVRRLVDDDGKGRGMRILEFNNGSGLRFTVYPDRGMDIGPATYKGHPARLGVMQTATSRLSSTTRTVSNGCALGPAAS